MTVTGNLTRDPQRRLSTKTGEPFAVMAVAVNNRRYDKSVGQWITTGTTYFDLLCWGPMGANALSTFRKGDPVIVHGRFRLNEWTSEKGSGTNATLDVESIGPDVSFGTAPFTRGNVDWGLDRVGEYNPGEDDPEHGELPADAVADPDDLESYTDEDGVVDDEAAEEVLARIA
ncbi:single-stranded DNA-binding protein [Ornithinimicrobium sp. LYQ103]